MQGRRRKPGIFVLVIILVVSNLLGQVKTAGKLLIPTARGKKSYKGIITITPEEIGIECDKKIFRSFNEFEAPKQAKIVLNTAEVEEIQIQIQDKKIFIITKDSFTIRYRNVFNRASRIVEFDFLFPILEKNWALIFLVDNPADMKTLGEKLVNIIGDRCDIRD